VGTFFRHDVFLFVVQITIKRKKPCKAHRTSRPIVIMILIIIITVPVKFVYRT